MNTTEYIKHLEFTVESQKITINSLYTLLKSKEKPNNTGILKIVHKK
jgi:hypothetical protein